VKKILAAAENPAFRFILMVGIVNLFADLTYEGGASINGQFLANIGASAATISIIAGLGEFFGYSMRSVSGYLSDKIGKPWLIAMIGYSVNLLAVPAMFFAHTWKLAALLIIAERVGRAIRKPTVEAMLSYTTSRYGRGWVYALNTTLDETGATLGPLLMTFALFTKTDYRFGYSILLIPAILALIALSVARMKFPNPADFENFNKPTTLKSTKFAKSYWFFMLAGAFFAAGLMSYEFIAFHLLKTQAIEVKWIPALLALSTGLGVLANLFLGRYYDKVGIKIVLIAVFLSSLFSPLVFFGGFLAVLVAMLSWGIGYATQDTLLKAVVAGLLPEGRRSFAFGLFYTGYGGGWLIGSVITGLLYDHSRLALVLFVTLTQLISLPIFAYADRMRKITEQ
jgi:MFS family permease